MMNEPVKLAVSFAALALLTFGVLQDGNRGFIADKISAFGLFRSRETPAPIQAGARVQPTPAPAGGWGVVELSADRAGQFNADVEIKGVRLRTLVDTGASAVALTAEDARALNLDPAPSAYSIVVQTANGLGRAAPVRLPQIRVGSIVIYDVDAVVMPRGALSTTLLGMTFLKRLSSFQVADGRFLMKQ